MVSRIGKVITPLLLIFLVILIGASFMNPMGIPQAPTDNYATPVGAAVQGFLDGYNTMDALAALVFGVIVVQSVKMFGKTHHKEQKKYIYCAPSTSHMSPLLKYSA